MDNNRAGANRRHTHGSISGGASVVKRCVASVPAWNNMRCTSPGPARVIGTAPHAITAGTTDAATAAQAAARQLCRPPSAGGASTSWHTAATNSTAASLHAAVNTVTGAATH